MADRFPDIDWWCDRCGAYLNTQAGFTDSKYIWQCTECGFKNSISKSNIVYLDDSDSGTGEGSCENCGQSLAGGSHYLPWEDGSNEHAYIVCPYCGTKNVVYGFGGDDD
ncbi:Sec23/Sec24 zinc finger-containing protein [Schleiferilactobacillus harbinensis]|nr:Sec23/Sec24 zinc finger-containing protein [Schleiferilactobacillus harbinensis]